VAALLIASGTPPVALGAKLDDAATRPDSASSSATPPDALTSVPSTPVSANRDRADPPADDAAQNGSGTPPGAATDGEYVDQLIEEPLPITDEREGAAEGWQGLRGRRALTLGYTGYVRDLNVGGTYWEQGLNLNYQHETEHYGNVLLDATLGYADLSNGASFQGLNTGTGGVVTLYDSGLPLGGLWQADSSAGVIRTTYDSVIAGSYRVQLPSSLLGGVSGTVRNPDNSFTFTAGSRARLTGTAVFQYESQPGELFGIGLSHRPDPRWTVHGQLWSLSGDPQLPDHETLAAAARYLAPDSSASLQLNALADSKENVGLWADAYKTFGPWKHRVGAFRLDPGLLWTDALIANDQQGVYWRTDAFRQRYNVSLGLEANQTNIDDDPSQTGLNRFQGFASGSYRVDRLTSIGATLDLVETQQGPGLQAAALPRTTAARVFANRALPFGQGRFEIFHQDTSSSQRSENQTLFTWFHVWPGTVSRYLTTTLEYGTGERDTVGFDQWTAGLTLRQSLARRFALDINANASGTEFADDSSAKAYNANLTLNWFVSRNWAATLNLGWTRSDVASTLAPTSVEEKSALLMLRYTLSGGMPLQREGADTGALGTGRLIGRVFFDANGDGLRQADEELARGVTIYLDGRSFRTTDRDGRFEFISVAAGRHVVTVGIEDLPLPWAVENEQGFGVDVPLRGEALVEIPLTRLRP
jgi:hypothetical protein